MAAGDVPAIYNMASIPRLFKHVKEDGLPGKVTVAHLSGVGFKSSNDRMLPALLKSLGFTDNSGVPTDVWKEYRDGARSAFVMAAAMRAAYARLFAVFPDAQSRTDAEITNWISANTTFAKDKVERALKTFRGLAALADFSDSAPPPATPDPASVRLAGAGAPDPMPRIEMSSGPAITINIQLQLPETDKPEVYENLFKAMRAHLWNDTPS